MATILDMLILITALFVFRLNEMSRWLLVFYCGIVYCVLVCKRAALRLTLRHYRRLGYNQKHVLVVGDGEMAAALCPPGSGGPGSGLFGRWICSQPDRRPMSADWAATISWKRSSRSAIPTR